ncbi:hypothetical protein PMAYCL1PPCAC_08076, partial [Pristionchus mayeri]
AEFPCTGSGCTVYATSAYDVGIYNGDTLLITLDRIYKANNGYLIGYHLDAGSDYRIRKTSTSRPVDFTAFIISDIAVTDVSLISGDSLDASGKKLVTILSTGGQISFSSYVGISAPKIYAAGFDSVDSCKPVYTAR